MFVTQYYCREIVVCAITLVPRFAKRSYCRSVAASLIALGLVFVASPASADCYSNPSGLIGWWPADGNANNALGTNNGALQGGATANTAGVVAAAFNFDGTNNYVQIADAAIFRPTNLTIEAWVRFAGLDTPGTAEVGHQYLVFKQNSASTDFEGYDLSKTRGVSGDVFEFRVSAASGQSMAVVSTTLIATGTWYHVAAVRGSNFLQLYVNGQLQRQTNVAFAQNYGTLPLYFGSSGQASWDRKFRGSLDEVSLYNRALSSNEVAAIYAAGAAGKCKEVVITVAPQNKSVQVGGSTSFSVAATGFGTLRYRWLFEGVTISGATNAVLSLTNVQPSNAGNYAVAVSNTLGSITSTPAVLIISTPPIITNSPQNRTVIVGNGTSFSVGAGGTAPLSYQWRKSGAPLAGQTSATLFFVSVATNDAGSYDVVVANAVGSVTSSPPATLTVNVPPFILAPPQNQTTVVGSNASFSVTAGGTLPLSYQWRRAGFPIVGQTGPTLALVNVATGDAGNFDVVITNVAGAVTNSPPATLTVNEPPFIVVAPSNRTVTVGSGAEFNVTAGGTAPLNYQWRKAGSPLSGKTSPTLTLPGVTTNDAGSYDVVVANVAGSLTSTPPAVLTVNVPPFINSAPQGQTVVAGGNANFSVSAGGTEPLTYAWQKDGSPLAGQTNVSLSLAPVTITDAGGYAVVITNVAGALTSSPPATLIVNLPPFVTNPPQSQVVTAGTNVSFTVGAGGTAPLSYQWRRGGVNLDGQTSVTLTLLSVSVNDAGNYDVVVSNLAGSATSTPPAVLIVTPSVIAPFITNAPVNRAVAAGANVNFSVTAGGTAPLFFQWRKNSSPLGGETNASLTLLSVTTNSAGGYDVVVTNVAGAVTSAPPATLTVTPTVNLPPFITFAPQSQVVGFGASVTFTVAAGGTAPLGYQWRKNGSTLNGATSAFLALSNVTTNSNGNYDVIVANAGGSVTSVVAVLTVKLIVDPELEKAIACTLNSLPNQIGVSSFAGLTNLFARGRGITNLAGLEFATNLAIADLSGNRINDLSPLAKLFRLNSLELDDNQGRIVALNSLNGLTNLTCLMLGQVYAGSSYSTLSNLTKLTSLKLNTAGVTDLDFLPKLTKLTSLTLSQNGIRNLSPMTGLTNLTQLDLRWNPSITNYNVLTSNLTNLVSLHLGGNAITNLPSLQSLRQLAHLNLSDNQIASLPSFAGPTNLAYLALSRNPIADYSSLSGLINLTHLELSGAGLNSLTSLSSLRRLIYLDLSFNAVTNLTALTGLTNLTGLVLAGNPVTNYSPLAGLNSLSSLWLHKSGLTDVTFVAGLPGVRHLNLDDNLVANALQLPGLTNLTGLGISGNPLGNPMAVAALTNLSSLRLDGYSLSDVSNLGSLRKLNYLSLTQNRVTNGAALAALTNLQNYYLNQNQLQDLSFLQQLPDLREVDLSLNLLSPTNGSPELSVVDDLHCQEIATLACGCSPPSTVATTRGVGVAYLGQHESPAVIAPSKWYVGLNTAASLGFVVTYSLAPGNPLAVAGISSVMNVIPNGNLSFSGSGDSRAVTVSPVGNQAGATTLSLFAVNGGGLTGQVDVAVTVLPAINVTNMLAPGVTLDTGLEHAFRSASGNYVGDLTSVDLLNATRLEVNGGSFTGFSGWQWLSNVTSLQLSGGAISDLGFLVNLPKLTTLSISGTAATNFGPVASLSNLTTLYLAGTAISNLTFLNGCTKLVSLGLNRTRVVDLTPLTALTNLTSLRLPYNTVANILALNNLPFLAYVDLRFNVLDTSDGSASMAVIAGLVARNVYIVYEPQRTAPLIQVANTWFVSGDLTSILSFEVSDSSETVFGQLVVGGSSSNPVLLPNSNLQVRPDTNSNVAEWMLAITPTPAQSGVTIVTLGATNDVGMTSITSVTVTVSSPLPLNETFFGTTGVTWRNGAGGSWFGQSAVLYQDSAVAQSANIVHGNVSTLEAELIGPGTLSFWWKVSSETNYDLLVFESSLMTNEISGQVDWQQKIVPIAPRTQVVRWRYAKDLNMVTGQDAAWLADVTFMPDTWLDFVGPPTNGQSRIDLYGSVGTEYEMQTSSNTTHWSPLGLLLSTNRITPFVDLTATNQLRFYRARASGF